MDERVFGPYYGMPPEQRTEPTRIEQVFHRSVTSPRRTLRQRILAGRKASRTRTTHRT